MGLGIIAFIKTLTPLSLYLAGVFLFFAAFAGKARWTLALVTLLLPLRNVVDKLQAYPGGTKFLTALIFAMFIASLSKGSSKKDKAENNSPINILAIILVVYTTISLIIGSNYLGMPPIDPSMARVQDWKNFCMMPLLYFITTKIVPDKKWVWRIVTVMCFTMFLMCYYTFDQVRSYSALVSRAKINGTFQFLGPNEVAAFYNEYTIILISLLFFMRQNKNKILLSILVIMNIYCMMFMYSRAAYIAFALGLFILSAFKNRFLLIPFIVMAFCWQMVLPEKAIERIKGTTNEYGELDLSSERRIAIWEVGLDLFKSSPIVGIGYGVFRHLGYDLGDTHNIYIKTLVEQGIVGLLIFFAVILVFMREGFQLYQKGDDDLSRGLGLGLFVCMFVFMVNNFFGDRWSYFELSSYLWVFAGLVSRLNTLAMPAQIEKARKKTQQKRAIYDYDPRARNTG